MKNIELGRINAKCFPHPPSWEQIDAFIKEVNMRPSQFERFYGIPYNMLTQIKSGKKRLPSSYWHFIYLKIKPSFGAGFIEHYNKKQLENRTGILTKSLPNKKSAKISHISHDRLQKLANAR